MILAVLGSKSRDKRAKGIATAAQTTTATNAAKWDDTVTALRAVFCVVDEFSQFVRIMTVRYSPIIIPPSRVSLANIVMTAKSNKAFHDTIFEFYDVEVLW
mmetsp:Transcript_2270/g.4772  ORF Transcript_2270/g.4772 Transcript_2270/m.4772 type:complete len:101 (+) Transcript_2270:2292-2594(+)